MTDLDKLQAPINLAKTIYTAWVVEHGSPNGLPTWDELPDKTETNRAADPISKQTWLGIAEFCEGSLSELQAARETLAGLSPALQDIVAERRRQISQEGWTPEHDDEHSRGEMARAAAAYAFPMPSLTAEERLNPETINLRALRVRPPRHWPWSAQWWKPKDRRRNLVRSGALIAAEIERLDRANTAEGREDG